MNFSAKRKQKTERTLFSITKSIKVIIEMSVIAIIFVIPEVIVAVLSVFVIISVLMKIISVVSY